MIKIMIQEIYKSILANNFTAKGQDKVNNIRLGIKRTFSDSIGRYIEIYPEAWGYSIFVYGKGFMNSYYPHCFCIADINDAKELKEEIKKRVLTS